MIPFLPLHTCSPHSIIWRLLCYSNLPAKRLVFAALKSTHSACTFCWLDAKQPMKFCSGLVNMINTLMQKHCAVSCSLHMYVGHLVDPEAMVNLWCVHLRPQSASSRLLCFGTLTAWLAGVCKVFWNIRLR